MVMNEQSERWNMDQMLLSMIIVTITYLQSSALNAAVYAIQSV